VGKTVAPFLSLSQSLFRTPKQERHLAETEANDDDDVTAVHVGKVRGETKKKVKIEKKKKVERNEFDLWGVK